MNLLQSETIHREFPVTQHRIFFDHARVAALPLRVRQAVEAFAADACDSGTENYPEWMQKVEAVRERFARFIGARPGEVAFVKNTTEGLSIVANGLDWSAGDNVVIPDIEFPSNVYPWFNLKRFGVETRRVPARDGRVLFEDLEAAVDARTRVLSISSVQFHSGFRSDLARIGAFCKKKGILFCVDAIQSLGVFPMDVKACGIDCLAADGHKWLLSLEGLGGFYISEDVLERVHPAVVGWDSVVRPQDFTHYDFTLRPDARRFEEGTANTLSIHAFGAALSLFEEMGMERVQTRILELGDAILERLSDRKISLTSSTRRPERSGNIVFSLDRDPAAFSAWMHENAVTLTVRDGIIRLSPHFYNREEEVDRFFDILDGFLNSGK